MHLEPIIKFNDFSWKYKSSKDLVLNNINLKINQGDFVGIMGPTGAGKSTLCSCINGLIPLRTHGWIKGTVEVLGMNTRTAKMTNLGKRIGLVFQDPETQFVMMTVEDEIALGLETLNLSRSEISKRIKWALEIVRLEGFERKSPEELSGGQKQRVAIASIMAMRPEILILDEPTSDLDPQGKEEVYNTLETIQNQFNLTIILVSHETKKILEYCNRIVLIDNGKIYYDGEVSQILHKDDLLKNLGIYIPSNTSDQQTLLNIYRLEKTKSTANQEQEKNVLYEVLNLSFIYPNGTQALNNVNFRIHSGDFVAIIGKNGSGKTTLIKHLNGLLKPQIGRVILNKMSISSYSISQIAQMVGFCYQNPDHQLFKNTIKEEIEFGMRNLKFPENQIENRYKDIIKLLDLERFEEIYESTFYLSKGIRQRLALASVLVLQPQILIIDEPTTGQDFKMVIEFMKILQDLNNKNHTIIIVTHNPHIIARFSREIIILDDGKLISKLSTIEFLRNKELKKVAAFTLI